MHSNRAALSAAVTVVIPFLCMLNLEAGTSPQNTGPADAPKTLNTPATPGLTVEDVTRLIQAGLSEDIIVATIKKNARPFDLSTDEILKLKQAGASNGILKAMLDPGAAPAAETTKASAGTPAKTTDATGMALPEEVGLYWAEQGKELQRIEGIAVSNTRTGSTMASKLTLGIKRARVNAQLKGARAQIRIKERQPQFYLYLPEEASIGDYLLLRLAQRLDVRQIEIGEKTMWKEQSGVDHARQVDFSYKRVKNRYYLLTPDHELDKGEYGFYVAAGVELKKASGRIYDFGVD